MKKSENVRPVSVARLLNLYYSTSFRTCIMKEAEAKLLVLVSVFLNDL